MRRLESTRITSRLVPRRLQAAEAQLERDVRAAVGAHPPAVEPHPRAVVDRLEAHRPRERPARLGQREVLAVPADAADHRGGRVVPEVPDVRHLHASTSRRGCSSGSSRCRGPCCPGRGGTATGRPSGSGRTGPRSRGSSPTACRRPQPRPAARARRARPAGKISLRAPRIRGITTQRPAGSRAVRAQVTRTTPRGRSASRSTAAPPRPRSAAPRGVPSRTARPAATRPPATPRGRCPTGASW